MRGHAILHEEEDLIKERVIMNKGLVILGTSAISVFSRHYWGRKFASLFVNALLLSTLSIEGMCEDSQDVIADGEEVSVLPGSSYGKLMAVNGGTLRARGVYNASRLVIDNSSKLFVVKGQRPFDRVDEPSGSGGAYGGRGGGPLGGNNLLGTLDLACIYLGGSGDEGKTFKKTYYRGPYEPIEVVVPGGPGGRGGGFFSLTADSVIVDGTVEANGLDGEMRVPVFFDPDDHPVGYGGGGGSGGGILLVAKEMHIGASAVIHANGGKGGTGPTGHGYGGGGGRIKLFYETGDISPSATIAARPAEEWLDVDLGPTGDWFAVDGTGYVAAVRSTDVLLNPESAGDVDGDGDTDSEDLMLFMSFWGEESDPLPTPMIIGPTPTPSL